MAIIVKPDYIPADYTQVKCARSMGEALNDIFSASVNCRVYPRNLTGDFNGLAQAISSDYKMIVYSQAKLLDLRNKHQQYNREIDQILSDMSLVVGAGFRNVILRAVGYNGYYDSDAMTFHQDGSRCAWRTRVLCCYNDPVTEYLRNDDVVFGDDGKTYQEPISRNPTTFRFRAGDICVHATQEHPNNAIGAVHRAPAPSRGIKRLVLAGE